VVPCNVLVQLFLNYSFKFTKFVLVMELFCLQCNDMLLKVERRRKRLLTEIESLVIFEYMFFTEMTAKTLQVIKGLRTEIVNFLQFIRYKLVMFGFALTMAQSCIASGEKSRADWILATLVRKFLEMHSTHVGE